MTKLPLQKRAVLLPLGCTVLALLAPVVALPARAEAPAGPLPGAPIATILDVQGPVTWHAKQEAQFREARGGENLFAGAVVQTSARGYAHLSWRNGGDFKLLPLSELAIPEEEGVLLNAGKIWAQFQHKLLVPFFFKSPTATAVVRGTTLGVEIGPEGATTVAVLEGRVEVLGRNGEPSRMLEPGQSLTVSPFGALGPIMPMGPQIREFGRMMPASPYRTPERGPERGPEPVPATQPVRAVGMFDWLQRSRASVRLESVRQQERGYAAPHPFHGEGAAPYPGNGPQDGPREPYRDGPREPMRSEPSHEGGRPYPRPEYERGRGPEGYRREEAQAISPDRALPVIRPATSSVSTASPVCAPINQPLLPGAMPGSLPVCLPPSPPPHDPSGPPTGGVR